MYEQMASICESINAGPLDQGADRDRRRRQGNSPRAPTSRSSAPSRPRRTRSTMRRGSTACSGALEQCRVPVIAAIAGACTGGGAGIAACCDIRIGTEATRDRLSDRAHARQRPVDVQHLAAGLADRPGADQGISIFKARLVEAPEALALGLLNEVVPDVETLQRRADETAKLVAEPRADHARGRPRKRCAASAVRCRATRARI